MLIKQATFLLKNLTLAGRAFGSLHQAPNPTHFQGFNTVRTLVTDNYKWNSDSNEPTPEEIQEERALQKELFGKLPKRPPNVFARFLQDQFKTLPADMTVKEKFAKSAETWRTLTEEQQNEYKKATAEGNVAYKQELEQYMESMTAEQLLEFKKLKKEKLKFKTRQRIRTQLRKLNYPKKPLSAYIFYLRDNLRREYPDGNYPAVKSPEHIRWVGVMAQGWKRLTEEEKVPFVEQAEQDRKRYFDELEEWKANLSKPENEEDLLHLERLSRKMENTTKREEDVKKSQKRVAGKVISMRLKKKGMTPEQAKKAKAEERAANALEK